MTDTEIPDSTWLAKLLDSSRMGGDPERDHAGVDAVFAVWLTGDDQEIVNMRVIRGRDLVPGRPGVSVSAEALSGERPRPSTCRRRSEIRWMTDRPCRRRGGPTSLRWAEGRHERLKGDREGPWLVSNWYHGSLGRRVDQLSA